MNIGGTSLEKENTGQPRRRLVRHAAVLVALTGLATSTLAPVIVDAGEVTNDQSNVPEGYTRIDGADGSWKIVPTQDYERSANAQSLDLVPEAELDTATPDRLQGMFNQYSAVVFGSASLKKGGANTLDPRLAIGGDLQLNARSSQPLAGSQPTFIGGDLYEQAGSTATQSSSLGDGPIVFAAGHGITGKGDISPRLQALLDKRQIFTTNQVSNQYFAHLKTASKALSTAFNAAASTVADSSSTTDGYNRRLFKMDDAHYNSLTNAYYFTVDASVFAQRNSGLVFSGPTKPNAKVIVNVLNTSGVHQALSLNGWQIIKSDHFGSDAKHVILNFGQAESLDTENTGNSLRDAVTIFAPNAAVTETDVFPIGTFQESNPNGGNQFVPQVPIKAQATIQYWNATTRQQVGDDVIVDGLLHQTLAEAGVTVANPDSDKFDVQNPDIFTQTAFTGEDHQVVKVLLLPKVPVAQQGTVTINYVADQKVLRTATQTGKVGAVDTYNTAQTLAELATKGFRVSDGGDTYTAHGPVFFTTEPQTFTISLGKKDSQPEPEPTPEPEPDPTPDPTPDPGQPSLPTTPGEPEQPEQPAKPEQPNLPAIPLEPSQPVEQPGDGDKPGLPNAIHAKPHQPAAPQHQQAAAKRLPRTGDQKSGILVSLGLLVLLTVSGYAFSRWYLTHKL